MADLGSPSINDLFRVMVLVPLDQTLLTDQYVLLSGVGALDTHPGGSTLAPLVLSRLAIPVPRIVLGHKLWPMPQGRCEAVDLASLFRRIGLLWRSVLRLLC